MNMNKTLSIIIPYIVLAVVFAALVQMAAYGFILPLESQTLAVLDQLSKGADIYAGNWGRAAAFAPVLQPAYLLASMMCGGYDGIAYTMRIVFVVIDFVVALVAYRALTNSMGRVISLFIALAYLVLVSNGADRLGPCGIGLTCAFVAALFAWHAYLAALKDDGVSSGYLRVLRPVLAGFFIVCAGLFSSDAGFLCIFALLFVVIAAQKERLPYLKVLLAWMLCGVVLASACYLLLVLGYGELGSILSAFLSTGGRAFLDSGLVPEFSALLLLGLFGVAVIDEDADVLKRLSAMALGLALISAAIQLAGAFAAISGGTRIQEGPAEELICSHEDVSVYEDVCNIALKVDGDSVYVVSDEGDAWAYLVLDGTRNDSEPEWVLKVGNSDDIKDAMILQNCGKIAGNDTCELYRRASTIGSISQG